MAGPEAKLTTQILAALRKRGGWWAKFHGGVYQRGIPDLLGCYNGKMVALEVKVDGRHYGATALQQKNIDEINNCGGNASVIYSIQDALKILDYIDESAL